MTLIQIDSFIFDLDKITFVEKNSYRQSLTLYFVGGKPIEIPSALQEKVWEFFKTKAHNLFTEGEHEPHRGLGCEYREGE